MTSARFISGRRVVQQARKANAARSTTLTVRAGAERVTQSKDDVIVSPSILSADFSKLGEQVCPRRKHNESAGVSNKG